MMCSAFQLLAPATNLASQKAAVLLSAAILIAGVISAGAATQTVTIPANSDTYVACQVTGPNTNGIGDPTFLSGQAAGLQLLFHVWNNCALVAPSQIFEYDGTGWIDLNSGDPSNSVPWLRDEVIVIRNPTATPVTLILNGTPLPAPLSKTLTSCCRSLLGSQVLGADTFENITGHLATDYTRVEVYRNPQPPNGFNPPFELYTTYTAAGWSLPFPALNPGESVLIKVNCNDCGPATQTVTVPAGGCLPVTCQVAGIGGNAIGNSLFLDTAGWASADGDASQVPNLLRRNPNGSFSTYYYFNDGAGTVGWFDTDSNPADSVLWNPGDGMTVCNNTAIPLTVTLTGTRLCAPVAKEFTPCILHLIGSQVLGSDSFENITGYPASDYASVEAFRVNPVGMASPFPGGPGGYDLFTFTATGGWSPAFPTLNAGESVYLRVNCFTGCVPVPSGLALWLPLDELSGTTTANLAAGGSNGTLINGPTRASGYVSNSLVFDGTNRYVDVADYPAINPGTGNLSLDAWVRRDPASGTQVRIIADKRDLATGVGYSLSVSFGNLLYSANDGSGQINFRDTGIVPADNQWHFIAVTVNRTSATGGRFYIDGTPTGTFDPTVRPNSLSNTGTFQVGRSPIGGSSPWLGGIDEVEMFNRALSATEILTLYGAGSSGKCKPPVIFDQPANLTATVGQQATFAVTALGTGGFSYQWYRNGTAIAGATSAQLTIPVVFSSEGLYHAVITGPFGVTTSRAAQLDVNGPDLWIRDDADDIGEEPNTLSTDLYRSDDIWIRKRADENYNPAPFPSGSPTWTPQPPENPIYRDPKSSSPNYIYVRVRNRGNAPTSGTEELHVHWAKRATGLVWPVDWNDNMESIPSGSPKRLYGFEVTKPRKNGATASDDEIEEYVTAVQTLDTLRFPDRLDGTDGISYFDKQNQIHRTVLTPQFGTNLNAAHGTLRFLPWHREMINRYENLLREVKPTLTLLYWDFTTDPSLASSTRKPIIKDAPGPLGYMGLAGVDPQNPGSSPGILVGNPFTNWNVRRSKLPLAPASYTFGSQPVLTSSYQNTTLTNTLYEKYDPFLRRLEGSHNASHGYVGGATNDPNNGAIDPIFFMIHANADRIWSKWQRQAVKRWAPGSAYDDSIINAELTSNLIPWDGTGSISPWIPQTSANDGGYAIKKTPSHHSIVYPPTYDDAPLLIPVLQPGECVIIELPFYPPSPKELPGFFEPQHVCLLARIVPVPFSEDGDIWRSVANNNNVAWKNVDVEGIDEGPFFKIAPGRIGGSGLLVRNVRTNPATVALRFDETPVGGNSLFNFGQVRVRLEQNLMTAWLNGGSQGVGVTQVGPQEILVSQVGATIAGLPLTPREAGHMDVALQLNQGYPHPNGAIYHLEVIQSDSQSNGDPIGGQRFDLDFNSLKLVAKGSEWRFLDGGMAPAVGWQQLAFDDQAWTPGIALFGFGRADVETGLLGSDAQTPATCYFRKAFEVPSPAFYQSLRLRLPQDDGAIVYLNGQEIARLNMPVGGVNPQTPALAPMVNAAARAYRTVNVTAALGLLVPGPNVLAVEVHPAAAGPEITNRDLTFDLELAGNYPPFLDQSPTVVVTAPENGNIVKAGLNIPIVADVVDADGDLTEVRILADGVLIATQLVPPFTSVFPNPTPGSHRVSVEARDQFGHLTRTESIFTALSNLPPNVAITGPLGATSAYNAPVVLTADAADPDGTVAEVRFYVKSHASFISPSLFAGADQTAPFTAQVSGLEPGMYMVTAEVTDNQGAVGSSSGGHFMVAKPPGVPLLGISPFENGQAGVVLDWVFHGAVLEHTPNLMQPWQPMPDVTSPFVFDITEPMGFFRLRLPHGMAGICGCNVNGGGDCNCDSCNCH